VDLFLVSLLTERAFIDDLPGAAPLPEAPEIMVPRIGEYLISQGLITESQLEEALSLQRKMAAEGRRRLLGRTLIEMGVIDAETLDKAINRQIMELNAALQETNRTLEARVEERTKELRQALDRLTEVNQIKANLISNVSHELRTPLAHIKGYLELVIDEELGELTDQQKEALSVMQRSTERLERLIEDLIQFSTASREGLTLHLQPISVVNLIENVQLRSQAKAKAGQVELTTAVAEGIPAVRADPERLEWVLLQLVDNAIKFTPPGGRVVVGAKDDGNMAQLFVRDTGIGIPSERLDEIYLPFHQLDGSPTRRYGGTGLGLALVKLILDAHGSTLKVESAEGKGSTFAFPLPLASETP
jgi:signal transduction histidine kinase